MPEALTVTAFSTPSHRREFLEFPYRLHAENPHWVAPLRSEQKRLLDASRHPFYRHAEIETFLARRGGRTVGRIAAIVDRNAREENGGALGAFGFFDCLQDQDAAAALVDAARRWLQTRGARTLRGPTDPSFNYNCGVLVDGFEDPPAVGVTYNPPYYDRLLTGAGLRPSKELLAMHLRREDLRSPRARRFARFGLATSGLRLRPYDARHREREIAVIWNLYSTGWSSNWGYVPASLEEVRLLATDLERIADLRLVQFCEVDRRAAGFVVVLPDWNQALCHARGRLLPLGWWRVLQARKRISRARIYLAGVLPEWQGTAVAAAFLSLADSPAAQPYREIEASWILEDNHAALRGMLMLGGRVAKRYRIYDGCV
jgi:hypothetical protein